MDSHSSSYYKNKINDGSNIVNMCFLKRRRSAATKHSRTLGRIFDSSLTAFRCCELSYSLKDKIQSI